MGNDEEEDEGEIIVVSRCSEEFVRRSKGWEMMKRRRRVKSLL